MVATKITSRNDHVRMHAVITHMRDDEARAADALDLVLEELRCAQEDLVSAGKNCRAQRVKRLADGLEFEISNFRKLQRWSVSEIVNSALGIPL